MTSFQSQHVALPPINILSDMLRNSAVDIEEQEWQFSGLCQSLEKHKDFFVRWCESVRLEE